MNLPLEIALAYIRRGWSPVPVPHKSKKPLKDEWQNLRITEADARQWFNGELQNVGVVLGSASGCSADVDLDSHETVAAAPFFLPRTMTFGRSSKRFSHWLYKTDLAATADIATIKFTDTQKPARVLLEICIGGGGKGAQTVFPFELPRPFGHRILSPARLPGSATLALAVHRRSIGREQAYLPREPGGTHQPRSSSVSATRGRCSRKPSSARTRSAGASGSTRWVTVIAHAPPELEGHVRLPIEEPRHHPLVDDRAGERWSSAMTSQTRSNVSDSNRTWSNNGCSSTERCRGADQELRCGQRGGGCRAQCPAGRLIASGDHERENT